MYKHWKSLIITLVGVALIFSFAVAKSGNYAWLGISTQTVDSELAKAFELPVEYGTIVNEIIEDSPADEAGIKEGDIIIAFNSDKIMDYDDLIDYLEDSDPDEKVTLTINRDGDEFTTDVTLGDTPSNSRRSKYFNRRNNHFPTWHSAPSVPKVPNAPQSLKHYYNLQAGSESYIGVQLTDLSDQLRTYFGIEDEIGVLVSEVEKDTPAEKAGIQAGDVIIGAGNEEVYNYRDLKNVIEDLDEGDIVDITVVRDKKEQSFPVTVAEKENDNVFYFNGPDINIQVPHFDKDHIIFSDDLHNFFDSEDFESGMEELMEALSELKIELHEEFNSKEFKNEMRQLKKELKTNKSELDKELKKEIEELKKELKRLEKRLDD